MFLYLQGLKLQWQPSTMVSDPQPESQGPAVVRGAGGLSGGELGGWEVWVAELQEKWEGRQGGVRYLLS